MQKVPKSDENRVKPVFDTTIQMKDLLEKSSAKTRDADIEQLNALIELRGKQLEQLTPPYNEEEKKLGQELIPINDRVQELMQSIFSELKKEIRQVKKQKSSNQKYINPYKNVQVMDGMYLDKKK